MEKKPIYTPSLVLMIIGAVFALLLPIVTYPCCVISLTQCVSRKETHNTTAILVIDIIALVLALLNSIAGVLLQLGVLQ